MTRYLPPFRSRIWDYPARPATFRQLVSHTAGLPNMPPMAEFSEPRTMIEGMTRGSFKFPTIEAVLASLEDAELVAPPMTVVQYSNLGVALLGHALERIADQPYQDYVMEHILQPLGMISSGFAVSLPACTSVADGGTIARMRAGRCHWSSVCHCLVPSHACG